MYSARRKWTQQGWRLFLLAAALGGAWYIRTYQSGAILELYGLLTRPFQGEETNLQEQLLADQRVRELQSTIKKTAWLLSNPEKTPDFCPNYWPQRR